MTTAFDISFDEVPLTFNGICIQVLSGDAEINRHGEVTQITIDNYGNAKGRRLVLTPRMRDYVMADLFNRLDESIQQSCGPLITDKLTQWIADGQVREVA